MTTKEDVRTDLHRLIDQLPEGELHAAKRFVEYLRQAGDPLLRKLLDAPEEDEELTAETRAALDEAEEDFKAGRVVSHEELKRELGL